MSLFDGLIGLEHTQLGSDCVWGIFLLLTSFSGIQLHRGYLLLSCLPTLLTGFSLAFPVPLPTPPNILLPLFLAEHSLTGFPNPLSVSQVWAALLSVAPLVPGHCLSLSFILIMPRVRAQAVIFLVPCSLFLTAAHLAGEPDYLLSHPWCCLRMVLDFPLSAGLNGSHQGLI